MAGLTIKTVEKYVNENIASFHEARFRCLERLNINDILKKKNPYLFKAKNINVSADFIKELLDAFLSSSEEKLFGDFLENLAVYIASLTYGGKKSAATGLDLEFTKDGTIYLVSVKSGPNWGNSSQQKQQEENFKKAIKVLRQSKHTANVVAVLGICYGKNKPVVTARGYMKLVGQSFWFLLSGKPNLYLDIIEPLGYKAKEKNADFEKMRAGLINRLTKDFTESFCDERSCIDWKKVVQFNSGNWDDNFWKDKLE